MTPAWAELRSTLAEEPGELAFRAACALLETWPDPDRAAAFAFAEQALASWPDEHRVAPWPWLAAAVEGHTGVTWPLARTLREVAGRTAGGRFSLGQLAPLPGDNITRLELNRYAHLDHLDEAAALAVPGRWPDLRHVRRLGPEDDQLEAFLGCEVLARLESLELFLPSRPTARDPVPGFTRAAPNLRRLDLVTERHATADVRPLLSAGHLPALREFGLKGQYLARQDAKLLGRIAAEPIFAQLHTIRLNELHEKLTAAVLTRPDVRPQRLELRNRPHYDFHNAAQERVCRLTAKGVRAIARGGVLGRVAHLAVENERVGDVVLELVAAAGELKTLELVNVGLTDAGAKRLAGKKQLAGVAHLNLQQNPLTAAGVASLVASPHLGSLRRLDLGSGFSNPYYGGGNCRAQAVGDGGAETLAASGLLGQLGSLSLRYAELGPRGAAVCAAGAGLRRLDLSANPFGPAGVRPFADAPNALHELDLSLCGLDDAACGLLARADFPALRSLTLAYNSIGPDGARHLAAARLGGLWRLNLHDNFVGDDGLTALAGSPHLGALVELDLEQDVWNYRRVQFGPDAAAAVARSTTFARLDALHAGVVDEYHGGRYRHGFLAAGMATVRASTVLRPPLRLAPDALEQQGDGEEPVEFYYHHDTPRETERQRRGHDFRGIPPLEDRLGPDDWRATPDPGWMLEFLGEAADERKLRLFACACARRVLPIAPVEAWRALLDALERFVESEASWAECEALTEAADAVPIEDHESPESSVRRSVENVAREPAHEGAQYAASCAVQATIAVALRDGTGPIHSNTYLPEHRAQADLLRCVFAPPGEFDAESWRTSAVVALAEGIHADRAFDRLPILADALQDAGCDDAEVLDHCRGPGPHVRGCWVVDRVLGRG